MADKKQVETPYSVIPEGFRVYPMATMKFDEVDLSEAENLEYIASDARYRVTSIRSISSSQLYIAGT